MCGVGDGGGSGAAFPPAVKLVGGTRLLVDPFRQVGFGRIALCMRHVKVGEEVVHYLLDNCSAVDRRDDLTFFFFFVFFHQGLDIFLHIFISLLFCQICCILS